MISADDLRSLAGARLQDAQVLHDSGRYDASVYLCGYSVELALKARICETLKWKGFPATDKEFQNLQSFRTHSFDVLVRLAGVEAQVANTQSELWEMLRSWAPDLRYRLIGTTTAETATEMLKAAQQLMEVL